MSRAGSGVVDQAELEIGIRLTLGAQMSQVKNMVVFEGTRLALVGVVIGVAAAFGLARVMSAFVFGVGTRDPLVFVALRYESKRFLSGSCGAAELHRATRSVDPDHVIRKRQHLRDDRIRPRPLLAPRHHEAGTITVDR